MTLYLFFLDLTLFPPFPGTCDVAWTGGFSEIPGSVDNNDWMWNLTDSTAPLLYIAWDPSEPNNLTGDQDAIALVKLKNYFYCDFPSNPGSIYANE